MPSPEASSSVEKQVCLCPLCGAELPHGEALRCSQCDWTSLPAPELRANVTRDWAAVLLSVVPGLGHLYKGHVFSGVLYFIGAVFAMLASSLAAAATAGAGLFLLPFYWMGIMLQVFFLEDRRCPQPDLSPTRAARS